MNTLEEHVLSMIGENTTTPDVFTDDSVGMAQIRGSINDAIEEVAMVTGWHKRNFYLALVSGEYFYDLNLDRGHFGWPTDAWLLQQKRRLQQVDPTWFIRQSPRWLYDTATPVRYGIIGTNVLFVHPAPSASTGVIELTAVVIPERYTYDDDRTALKDSYKWAVVHYAVSEYWASRGDAQTAATHHQTYIKHLGVAALYNELPSRQWEKKTEKTA
jgi:hypothetical protein